MRTAELDREMPAALFAAVAQVLAYVYQLRAALAGQAPIAPAEPCRRSTCRPSSDPHEAARRLSSGNSHSRDDAA